MGAIQTRGYSFPIQSELAAKLEYAAAKGASTALRVTTEAIVEHSRVGRLSTLIDALPMPGLFARLEFERSQAGVIGFDMALVDHVVDILAGGDPDISHPLPARTPTAIDATAVQTGNRLDAGPFRRGDPGAGQRRRPRPVPHRAHRAHADEPAIHAARPPST